MARQSFAVALKQENGELEVLTEYTYDLVQLEKDKNEVRKEYPVGVLGLSTKTEHEDEDTISTVEWAEWNTNVELPPTEEPDSTE